MESHRNSGRRQILKYMTQNEPTWAVVLHTLYENGMAGDSFDELGYSEFARKQAIAKEVDRDPAEVSRAIREMVDTNLINDVPTSNRMQGYSLTKKGFDVAHTRSLRRQEQQRENRRDQRQHEVNRAIGFLTFGLLVIGLVQATTVAIAGFDVQLLSAQLIQLGLIYIVLTAGLGVIAGIIFLLWRSGMLESWDEE